MSILCLAYCDRKIFATENWGLEILITHLGYSRIGETIFSQFENYVSRAL